MEIGETHAALEFGGNRLETVLGDVEEHQLLEAANRLRDGGASDQGAWTGSRGRTGNHRRIGNQKCKSNQVYYNSVPARLGKGQGAKEIGHNLARERQFRAQTTPNLLRVNDQNLVLWAIDENMGTNLQAFLHRLSENTKTAITFCKN